MKITISDTRSVPQEDILALYKANRWSAAEKPGELYRGLMNSHSLFTARDGEKLVGLGNAISDGFLVVYYPHLLVHPQYQGMGIGKMIMAEMQKIYSHFHMQILTSDGKSAEFYEKCGFKKAGQTQPMWIYSGNEH